MQEYFIFRFYAEIISTIIGLIAIIIVLIIIKNKEKIITKRAKEFRETINKLNDYMRGEYTVSRYSINIKKRKN